MKKTVIFGAGQHGKRILNYLKTLTDVICFIDNDSSKWETLIEDVVVKDKDYLREIEFDYIVIASILWEQMEMELVYQCGIDYKKIKFSPFIDAYDFYDFLESNPWELYAEKNLQEIASEIAKNELNKYYMYNQDRNITNKVVLLERVNWQYDANNMLTLNEKIRYMEAFIYDRFERECTDKYKVRRYIDYCGLTDILTELYFRKDSIEEIEFEELPQKFVIKTNNSCGTNIICHNKEELKWDFELARLRRWWKRRIELIAYEWHYEGIEKCIVCEEYLENKDHSSLVDYKYFCCNGKIECILVCYGRDAISDNVYHVYYNADWERLDYAIGSVRNDTIEVKKPMNLKMMNDVAEKLAKIFPFVRVDLYNLDGKIYFGELTFSPLAGIISVQSDFAQKILASKIDINYMREERDILYKKVFEEQNKGYYL